jgi:MFS family permease
MANQLRDHSPDDIAWIGSLMAFIQFAGGLIAGPLFDRYGEKIIWPGAVLYVFGLMMTSICKEYWQFMLAQGVLTGFAMSILQVPAFAAVSQYFDKKRGAALGLVVSGSSIGGIVFPIALSKMMNGSTLGFGWSLRIMAFVITPLLAFACFSIRARLPPRKTNFFIVSALKETKFIMVIAASFCCFVGMFTPLFFLPSYAVSRGMEPTLASYLLAIVNGASTFGRIIPGVLADKFGKLNVFGIGGLVTGAVVLCMNSAVSTAGLVVYSVAFGLWSGTIISGASAAFSVCTDDPRTFGTYMGMGMALASTASLLGPPVNGVLLDKYGGFLQVSIFGGVICLAGGVLAIVTKITTTQGLFGRV